MSSNVLVPDLDNPEGNCLVFVFYQLFKCKFLVFHYWDGVSFVCFFLSTRSFYASEVKEESKSDYWKMTQCL